MLSVPILLVFVSRAFAVELDCFQYDKYYVGSGNTLLANTGPQCASLCRRLPNCKYWTWNGGDHCFVKGKYLTTTLVRGYISGTKECSQDLCTADYCTTNGRWSEWSGFGHCSVSCGVGKKRKTRLCNNPAARDGGLDCAGKAEHSETCFSDPCPAKNPSSWAQWSDCSVTCGSGSQTRRSLCTGGKSCSGSSVETRPCERGQCSRESYWAEWGAYGKCSVTCGRGTRTRSRVCRGGGTGPCQGPATEETFCERASCPAPSFWSAWSPWGGCSATCGVGTHTRRRTCSAGKGRCAGTGEHSELCKVRPCPVDGGWSEWSVFHPCPVTCGKGRHSRVRRCDNPAPKDGGKRCSGSDTESSWCYGKERQCPVDGGWSDWSPYSLCSVSCGSGKNERTRTCSNPRPGHGGAQCVGRAEQTQECYGSKQCPVHGAWTLWSHFGPCSATCVGAGSGRRVRTRSCTNPAPRHGGDGCAGHEVDARLCHSEKDCPVDGGWSDWSHYSQCSVTCGDGIQIRVRLCNNPPPHYGGRHCLGNAKDSTACHAGPCGDGDGSWSEWSDYGPCSANCGCGVKTRRRHCLGGFGCGGPDAETTPCEGTHCPVDGAWAQWTDYGSCSAKCGLGTKQRTRRCDNPKPSYGGQYCTGETVSRKTCRGKMCPQDGQWSQWGDFGRCSADCGIGHKSRQRKCDYPPPSHGGKNCVGPALDHQPCNGTFHRFPCLDRETYYIGGGVFRVYPHVPSHRMCLAKCGLHPAECQFWIWSEASHYCVMKDDRLRGRVRLRAHISGPRRCCSTRE